MFDGDPKTEVTKVKSIKNGDDYNLSAISISTHTGTHIDAPLHFSDDGSPISKMRLNTFTGKCTVVTVNGILTGEDMDKILAEAGIAILENLDLSDISDGDYELFAFPIKLGGLEAAPCRAILFEQERGL